MRRRPTPALAGALLLGLCLVAAAPRPALAAKEEQIFLPADCDVLKIVGNGFQLELSKFDQVKRDFRVVEQESAQIGRPRDAESERGEGGGGGGGGGGEDKGGDADKKQVVVVNESLFELAKREGGARHFGAVDDDLMRWISDRATSLLMRVQRYNQELAQAAPGGNRIVLNILLLNTLVDLDNLNKEAAASLRWVQNKMQKMFATSLHREARAREVLDYVAGLIDKNKRLELAVTGTNQPGRAWVTNTQALKRVLAEQRFSKALGATIIEFLAGRFNMMKRSVVYEQNRQSKQLDDGLCYWRARGRVPADFPFTAQDAIAHGAYN